MMHYISIHQPSNRCSLRMLRAVFGRSEPLVVKLLRDFPHFNVILDIHEKLMHLMPHLNGQTGNYRAQKLQLFPEDSQMDTITVAWQEIQHI